MTVSLSENRDFWDTAWLQPVTYGQWREVPWYVDWIRLRSLHRERGEENESERGALEGEKGCSERRWTRSVFGEIDDYVKVRALAKATTAFFR
jgi:hypothetical protein